MRDKKERVDFLEHVFYEIYGYLSGYIIIFRQEDFYKKYEDLIIAVTGLHARTLVESFTDKKCADSRIVKIRNYYGFNKTLKYCEESCTSAKFKCFAEVYSHICVICNHLSKNRQSKTNPSWKDCFEYINNNMLPYIKEFMEYLKLKDEYNTNEIKDNINNIIGKIEYIFSIGELTDITDTSTERASNNIKISD